MAKKRVAATNGEENDRQNKQDWHENPGKQLMKVS